MKFLKFIPALLIMGMGIWIAIQAIYSNYFISFTAKLVVVGLSTLIILVGVLYADSTIDDIRKDKYNVK